jgi:diguanylate cyclase (GGDEF)-like protein
VSEDLSSVLSEFAQTMLTDFPIQGILDHLVKRIVDIMPITAAGVTMINSELDPRYIAASNGAALRFETLQTELREGPCLAAYRTGAAVEVPDLRLEDRFPRFAPRALSVGLAAVFTFPLRHGDVQLGALDLYRDVVGPLSPDAMTAAQTLANVAAAYLINAQGRADLKASSEQSRQAVLRDALTGLPNRLLMLELLEHAFRRSHRSRKLSAMFFLDLDRFRAVNDTYGHRVGDELLVAVAQRLTEVLRPGDSLGRLSGDEFVVLCEDLDAHSQAQGIAVRFDAALTNPFVLSGLEVSIGVSIGIAFTSQDQTGAERIMRNADLDMYQTKREKDPARHSLEFRAPRASGYEEDLEQGLPGAAARDELHLAYQPIVTAAGGQITGVEALLRWTHPHHGLVEPTALIPLAEQSGEIIDIGRWVLGQAWADLHDWHSGRPDDLAVSVNVSTQQLMSAGFADTVAAVLDPSSMAPGRLTLEITESVFLRDGERALLVLNDLKDMGVMLALDDFGTGYSSLGYLRRFPVDTVKIDREFIANLGQDAASHTIVSAVIQLAHGLGMKVVAEGVETPEQNRELVNLGCDFCQGFYFARPMISERFGALVADQSETRKRRLPGGSPRG